MSMHNNVQATACRPVQVDADRSCWKEFVSILSAGWQAVPGCQAGIALYIHAYCQQAFGLQESLRCMQACSTQLRIGKS